MRTTVTLDADTEMLLRRQMSERGVSFKQALNDAVREGLAGPPRSKQDRFRTPTFELGIPTVSLDRALHVSAELEDEEVVRKARVGK